MVVNPAIIKIQYYVRQLRVLIKTAKDLFKLEKKYDALIVPTNQYLIQCRLPYITKGQLITMESLDAVHSSSQWGGMEIDQKNQLYPIQCVDGRVQASSGPNLTAHLAKISYLSNSRKIKLLAGQSIVTPSFCLEKKFSFLAHTAIPHQNEVDSLEKLIYCYYTSVAMTIKTIKNPKIATSLLGNGARGFSNEQASIAAFEACKKISSDLSADVTVEFVLRDPETAFSLAAFFKKNVNSEFKAEIEA
jgi:hypothetical protein